MTVKVRYGFADAVESISYRPVFPYKDVYTDAALFEVEAGSQDSCDKAALRKITKLQKAHDDLYRKRVEGNVPVKDFEEAPKYINHFFRIKDGKKEMYSLWGGTVLTENILGGVNAVKLGKEPPKVSRKEKWLSFLAFCCFMALLSAIAYIINALFIK